ncbi:hypothetical protein VNO78_13695 [Psophocarpus tetragonolobus]|uniref:Uncharacterized protein n=1 Tax=Psophocarpus tetragonolobus TaxID=3891 RepID=A0AAN9SS74_PSOTE
MIGIRRERMWCVLAIMKVDINEEEEGMYQSGFIKSGLEARPLAPGLDFAAFFGDSDDGRQHDRQNGAVLVSNRKIRQNGVAGNAFSHREWERVVDADDGFEARDQRLFAFIL